jgi:aspartate ammonia-lyase
MVEENVGIVTALVPYIGYQASCDIAKEARATGRRVRDLVIEKGLMTEKELNHAFAPSRITRPGKPDLELNRHRVAANNECAAAKS